MPEVPSGNRNLLLYTSDPWEAPQTGYYQFYNAARSSETYNGSVVYKTWGDLARLALNFEEHIKKRNLVKVGDELTYSVWMKTDSDAQLQTTLFVRYKGVSGAEWLNNKSHTIALTKDWQKISVTFTVTNEMLSDERPATWIGWEQTSHESGKYVYYACNKLECGSVATPYSVAPEDLGWSIDTLVPTQDLRYLWKFDYIYYSDNSVEITPVINLSVAGREETHRDITFWHGLSASKHPLGIYDCGNRDHAFANNFTVVSGKKYTVKVIAQRQKGTINLKGGIWYTEQTSGRQYDSLAPFTQVGDLTEDGLGIWKRTLTVPDGKTKAQVYVQLEQSSSTGYTTAWRIYDAQVFDENGTPLVTDQNTFGGLTTPMAAPYGTYIWKRTIRHFSDGATTTDWEYSGIGGKGADGIAGKDGVGVKSHLVTYGLSASETTQPTSWSTQVPTLTKGNYLWTKTTWTYTDNTTETGYQKTYIAKDGNNGKDGTAGKDGVGIKSTAFFYVASTSGTTKPTTGWSTTIPNVPPGNYLWTKTVWTYTDTTSETGYSVSKMGESQYTHFAYCNITKLCNENASFTLKDKSTVRYGRNDKWFYKTFEAGTYTASNATFGGDPYSGLGKECHLISDFSLTDSTGRNWLGMYSDNLSDAVANPSYFTWQLTRGATGPQGIQGIQGPKGDQGIPGPKGDGGKTQYTHIAYADNDRGGGFSQTDQTKAYIGMYVDFTATDSTDVTKYKWSKWHGDQGIPGPKGDDGRTPYFHVAYANSADGRTGFTTTNTNNKRYLGTYTDYTQADSTDPTKYKWVDMVGTVEVGVVNLLRNSKSFTGSNITGSGTLLSETYQGCSVRYFKNANTSSKYQDVVQFNNIVNPKVNSEYVISFWAKGSGTISTFFHGPAKYLLVASGYTSQGKQAGTYDGNVKFDLSDNWQRYWVIYKLKNTYPTSDTTVTKHLLFRHDNNSTEEEVWLAGCKVEDGNVPTPYTRNPDDVQEDIDSKADQAITQQQLEALEAKRQQMIIEIEAKATLEQVSELTTFLNNLKKEDTDGRQKIIELTNAIEERVKSIEPIMDYSQKMQFIDTYITQGNGGMVIGANDSTTKVVVTPNRISFQDGGSEVAYISQSVLHIDNGVFTMSLQLGHFITRAHPKNQYVNATYFVK